MNRLGPETFDIPVSKIRRGYYSAVYFWRAKRILEETNYNKNVLMQVFQKNNAVLCGADEAIAVLKLCAGEYQDQKKANRLFDEYQRQEQLLRQLHARGDYCALKREFLKKIDIEIELDQLWVNRFSHLNVMALHDGDKIAPWETVMTIEGLPQHFVHLESVYLGILARRTLVATNVARVVEAAQGKPILFFADRFDHYENQTGDGYAAMKSGAQGIATDTMGQWWGNQGSGTMPHALIACFEGDTAAATLAFARRYPDVPCISLVDFDNNCVSTSLEVARAFSKHNLKLWGVRLDTSENMVDESIISDGQMGQEKPTGVNPMLVNNVREALDRSGFQDVKIVVSGGFDWKKVEYFEKNKVPVYAYGCGSSLIKGGNDFTADIVKVEGRPCAKMGRWYRPNQRLEAVG